MNWGTVGRLIGKGILWVVRNDQARTVAVNVVREAVAARRQRPPTEPVPTDAPDPIITCGICRLAYDVRRPPICGAPATAAQVPAVTRRALGCLLVGGDAVRPEGLVLPPTTAQPGVDGFPYP